MHKFVSTTMQYITIQFYQGTKIISDMLALNFDQEINKLQTALHNFAFKLTKSSEDTKDLFQETAYRAFVNKDKFREGTNIKAWMFTIMRNIFINNYRKKIKNNTILDSTDNQFYLNSGSVSVINQADSAIMQDELQQLVDDLDDGIRIPFMMHFYGYKYQEISDQLALPLGTVKSRIFFARKELKASVLHLYQGSLGR